MIEPPIDERYELAAVKESLTADERKAAEHAYTVNAFDYEKAPVGSRDWTLFWSGWQKCAAQKAQPPCGADGAVPDVEGVIEKIVEYGDHRENEGGSYATFQKFEARKYRAEADDVLAEIRALLASQPAAPVDPIATALIIHFDGWTNPENGTVHPPRHVGNPPELYRTMEDAVRHHSTMASHPSREHYSVREVYVYLHKPAAPVAPATVAVPESKRSCFTCKHADADDESYPCRDCTMMAHWSSSASQSATGGAK